MTTLPTTVSTPAPARRIGRRLLRSFGVLWGILALVGAVAEPDALQCLDADEAAPVEGGAEEPAIHVHSKAREPAEELAAGAMMDE